MSANETAVRVENLDKIYRIGVKEHMHDSFGSSLFNFLRSPWKNYRRHRSLYNFDDLISNPGSASRGDAHDVIWALRDVSFELKQGEALGVIGSNGAGKSTLLKVLSRVTDPTRGRAEIRGRVSSLLEVGTGFHPELTGIDNVYLNGAVLGMRKTEIDRKLDDIVRFSGVEKFVHTPVKRYSSGMKVRLAFSVAAHLEPEVLLVDEVLAVGDALFQKRCFKKLNDVGKEGRTVIVVSHNMDAITRLCSRCILLDHGKIVMDGPTKEVVKAYLEQASGLQPSREWSDSNTAPGDDVVRLRAVRVRNKDGEIASDVVITEPFSIQMEFQVIKSVHWLLPNFNIYNENNVWIFTTFDQDPTWRRAPRPAGRYTSTCWVPGNVLSAGVHFVEPAMMTPEPFAARFRERDGVAFFVVDHMEPDGARGDWTGIMGGVVRPLFKWTTEFQPF